MKTLINVNTTLIDLEKEEYINLTHSAKEFSNSIKLDDNLVYDVALDQSNTCTGLTIMSTNNRYLFISEIINDGIDFDTYRRTLILILKRILGGKNVRYLIIEKPLGFITGKKNIHLDRLKKMLEDFINTSNDLKVLRFEETSPQTWRSGLMKKDNPFPKNSKEACVFEVNRLYPLTKYFKSHIKSNTGKADYDGLESLGILLGFKSKHSVNADGERIKILGPLNSTKQAFTCFIYEQRDLSITKNILKNISIFLPNLDSPCMKYYNEDYSLYENIRMSLVDDLTFTLISKSLDVICILNYFNLKFKHDNVLSMIVLPNSVVNNKLKIFLKDNNICCEIYY